MGDQELRQGGAGCGSAGQGGGEWVKKQKTNQNNQDILAGLAM